MNVEPKCQRCGGTHAQSDLTTCAERLTNQLRVARIENATLVANLSEVLSELTQTIGIRVSGLDIPASV